VQEAYDMDVSEEDIVSNKRKMTELMKNVIKKKKKNDTDDEIE